MKKSPGKIFLLNSDNQSSQLVCLNSNKKPTVLPFLCGSGPTHRRLGHPNIRHSVRPSVVIAVTQIEYPFGHYLASVTIATLSLS